MPITVIGLISLVTAIASAAPVITLAPSSGTPDTVITVSGSGFAPDEILQIRWDGSGTGNVRTDESGAFTTTRTVPAGAALGAHTVLAQSVGQGTNSATATFTVTSPPPPTTTTTSPPATTTTTAATTTTSPPATTTTTAATTTTTTPPPTSTSLPPGATTGAPDPEATTAAPTTSGQPGSSTITGSAASSTTSTVVPGVIGLPDTGRPTDGGRVGDNDPESAAAPLPGGEGSGTSLEVSNTAPAPGDAVRVIAVDVPTDGSLYDVMIGSSVVASAQSPTSDGRLTIDVTVPEDVAGSQILALVRTSTGDVVASTTLTVSPSASRASAIATSAVLGLLAVLIAALVLRRKRSNDVVASAVEVADPAVTTADLDRRVSVLSDGPSPALVAPIIANPARPWSDHDLAATPIGYVVLGDLTTWDGAMWITGTRGVGSSREVVVASSLNGITWTEPTALGPGSHPRFVEDHSQISVIAPHESSDGPRVWMSRDGIEWSALVSGGLGGPRGEVTAMTALSGLVMLACTAADGPAIWAGRRDGQWIRLEIGMRPALLTRWDGRLLAFGVDAEGDPALLESEAGIRWTPVPLDVPPSFRSFEPVALVPIAAQLLLLGTDEADGIAAAWISADGAKWDPAPLGRGPGSRMIGAIAADGGVLAIGASLEGAVAWRTQDGVDWQRTDNPDLFGDFDVVAIARYEGRVHLLGADVDVRPIMLIRQPWSDPMARTTRQTPPRLQIVVDQESVVERPA